MIIFTLDWHGGSSIITISCTSLRTVVQANIRHMDIMGRYYLGFDQMLHIITDKPLEDYITDRLPPLQDFRDWYSQSLGVPFPSEMGLEEWFDSLPPLNDGRRWRAPPWGVPPGCKEILHLGAVNLVDMTYDEKRYALNSLLGTNEQWHFYVEPHETGHGGGLLRIHMAMLFIYWYLSEHGGRVCLFAGEDLWDDDTPVASIDVSGRLPGERPLKRRTMDDVIYVFYSSDGMLKGHDVGRFLHRMGVDTDGTNNWFYPKDGLTLEELMDTSGEAVYAVIVYDAKDRYDPDCDPPHFIEPLEVVYINGDSKHESDREGSWDIRYGESGYGNRNVSRYTITSEHRVGNYLAGTTLIDCTDYKYRVFLLAFIDLDQGGGEIRRLLLPNSKPVTSVRSFAIYL